MSWLSKLTNGGAKETAPAVATGPASVVIGSQEYGIAELKVRTFRISPYDGDLIAHQGVRFTLKFSLGGEEVSFPGTGIVLRIDENTGLLAQFTAPQPFYERKLLTYLAHRRLRAGGR